MSITYDSAIDKRIIGWYYNKNGMFGKAYFEHNKEGCFVKGYNWEFNFDTQFPVHMFPYHVVGNRDQIHWHRYYEIGLCVSGEGRFVYYNKEYTVHAGDIFISNNYESHVAIGAENQTTDYLFLIFLPSFISVSDGRWVDRQYLATLNYNPLQFVNQIPAENESAKKIAQYIREGYDAYSVKASGYQMTVDIIVRKVLLECSLYYTHQQEDTIRYFDINPKIRAAQEYINNNYNWNITLNNVAENVGINASYLRHLFKAETQVSFKEYVTCLRLSQARAMLLSSQKSINHIIEEVGYTNISQFYRIFKQHYNMTPAQYREIKHDVML